MQKGNLIIEPKIVHDIIAVALSEGWSVARQGAPVDTGFLQDHIFVYMTNNYNGFIVSEADYSAAVEKGYRNRSGKFVGGRAFMQPAFNVVRTKLKANMDLLVKAISQGIRPAIGTPSASIKTGSPSVAHKPSRTFGKQKTVTPKGRYYYSPSVGTVQFKKPLTLGLRRVFRFQRIGGR